MTGRRLRTLIDENGPLHRDVVWDGLDAGGNSVQPGLYFMRLEGAGESKLEQIAVVR